MIHAVSNRTKHKTYLNGGTMQHKGSTPSEFAYEIYKSHDFKFIC